MKLKAWSLLLVPVFALLLFRQVSLVNAENTNGPITSPISFPNVTPTPVPTPPITFPQPTPTPTPAVTPAPSFNPSVQHRVSGKVEYQVGSNRVPAQAQVQINGVGSSYKIYTITDTNGNFSFTVRENNYEVRAQDKSGTSFQPAVRVISVNQDVENVNFVGNK